MKNFRLLLVMSSLFALVCSFTACSTDIADNYPTITVSVEAGATTDASVSFTIKAQGADDIYYWVYPTPAEGEENYELLIEKGSYLDASVDTPFEQVVTKTGLKATTEYNVHVYAKNFAHSDYATPVKLTTVAAAAPIPAPTIAVVLDEAEVYPDSFLAFVTVAGAQKAAWLAVPKYTPGVTAEKVFAEGTLITDRLEGEVAVIVDGLAPATDYDFYVAADNQGVLALSEVVAVTTATPEAPVVEVVFDEVMQSMDLVENAGLPGIYTILRSSSTGAMVALFMYDLKDYPNYPGYLTAGVYPALTGSYMEGILPEASCLLADTNFTYYEDATGFYTVVGDLGTDADGNAYGVEVLTVMPDQDNNLLSINLPIQDANGNVSILRGEYVGPLGYQASIAAYPMNLNEWHFTNFTATVNGDVVTLKSSNQNGDFDLILQTENGQWLDTAFVAGEGGNLTGGYTSYLEGAPETFVFVSGRIQISKAATGENDYILTVSSRAGDWLMQSQNGAYIISAPEEGYAITVEFANAPAETLSIDGKRWQLPEAFALATIGQPATCFVDMGVSAPGKFFIAADLESVYGPDAAGYAQNIMGAVYDYTVQATDATSGNILLAVTDHFGDVTNVPIPYSNLTAESVTIDFTNVFGNYGITTCECTLFTKTIVGVQ